jgi:hypothetical protein
MAEELDPTTHLPEEDGTPDTSLVDAFKGSILDPKRAKSETTAESSVTSGGYKIDNSNTGGWFAPSKLDDVKSYLGLNKQSYNAPTTLQGLNKRLADNQGWAGTMSRTTLNMFPNIASQVLENAGGLYSLIAEWGDERDYTNGLVEWAKKNRNPFGEIYRQDPNAVIDLDDPAWWFEQGGGLLESVGAFALTGAGVGGALSKGSSALAKSINASAKVTRGLGAGSAVGTSASLAYTEGAMSGATVFQDVYQEEFDSLLEEGVDDKTADETARHKAAQSAATTVRFNTAINTLLNISSASPFLKFKGIKNAKSLGLNQMAGETNEAFLTRLHSMKKAGLKPTPLNTAIKYGAEAGQESAEELVNVIAERIGLDTEDEKDIFEHFVEAIQSDEGLLSMALGALGGVGQTGVTHNLLKRTKVPEMQEDGITPVADPKTGEVKYSKVSRAKAEKLDKTNQFNNYIDAIIGDLETISTLNKDITEAHEKGEVRKVEKLKRKLFNISLRKSVTQGSGEELKQTYREILELSPEDAVERGLAENINDTEYKDKATEAIEDITEADEQWREFSNKYNYGDEEALGLGRHTFQLWLDKKANEKGAAQARAENNTLRNKVDTNNDYGAFDALTESQSAEQALKLQQEKIDEVDTLKNTKKGKRKLRRKHGTSVKQIYKNIEKESARLANQQLEAEAKAETALKSYEDSENAKYEEAKEIHDEAQEKLDKKDRVPYPGKKKTKEQLVEEFQQVLDDNSELANRIIINEAHAKLWDVEKSSLGKALNDITSKKGREAFVKEATKDLDARIETQKKNKAKTDSKKAKVETQERKAKAKAKPKGDTSGEEPTAKDIDAALLAAEQRKKEGQPTRESDEVAKALFNALHVDRQEEHSPMFSISEDSPSRLDFGPSELMKELLITLEKEGEIDIMDFKAVSTRLNETLGAKAYASIFEDVRSLYAVTAQKPEVRGPEFEYDQIFRTKEEQEELDKDAVKVPVEGDGSAQAIRDYNDVLSEIEASISNSDSDENVETKDSKGNVIGLGDLIVPAGTAFAYLTQAYKTERYKSQGRTFTRLSTSSNELLESMQEPLLLSPNHFQIGDKVTIKVAEEFAEKIDGEKVTYSDLAAKGEDYIPIGIYKDGDLVAYLHTPDWITAERVANTDGNIEQQLEILKNLRKSIIENGETTSNITAKSYGKLIYNVGSTVDNKGNTVASMRSVSEAFPDPNLSIAIGRSGVPYLGAGTPAVLPNNGTLINQKELQEGVPYVLAPTPVNGKYIALPVRTKQLGMEYAESIALALDIYFEYKKGGSQGVSLTDSQKKLVEDLKKDYKTDITTEEGMEKYFSIFGYNSHLNDDQILEIINNEDTKNYFGIKGNGVSFVGGGTSRGAYSKNTIDTDNLGYTEQRDAIVAHLARMYTSIRLENLQDSEFKLPVISEDNGTLTVTDKNLKKSYREFISDHTETNLNALALPDGTYSYFAQPVITVQEAKAPKRVIAGIVKKGEPKPPTGTITDKDSGIEFDLDNFSEDAPAEHAPSKYTEEVKNVVDASIKGLVLPNTSTFRQQQIIGAVNGAIMKLIKKNDDKMSAKEAYAEAKKVYERLSTDEKSPEILKKRLVNVLEMWDDVTSISQRQLRALGILNAKGEVGTEPTDAEILGTQDQVSELDTALSEMESNYEKENYSDGLTFQIDAKNTMSARLRQFFAFVPEIGKSYLGTTYVPFDTVINTLNEQLAGVVNSEEEMLGALKLAAERMSKATGDSWMNNLVKEIEEAPTHVKNEIMVFGSKHYANFKTVLWGFQTTYEADGTPVKVPKMQVIDTNRYAISKVIHKQWQENLKGASDLVTLSSDGDMVIDEKVAAKLAEDYKAITKLVSEKSTEVHTKLQAWLEAMGVDISEGALTEIEQKSNFLFKSDFAALFKKNGIFFHMNERLLGKEDDAELSKEDAFHSRNPLTNNSGIEKLAALEAKYTLNHLSNSHKNGEGQTIFSYAMNKALTHRLRDLKGGQLIEQLGGLPFTRLVEDKNAPLGTRKISSYNSLWAKGLMQNVDPLFAQHFNVTYLDTLSKRGDSKATTLSNMSPKELEFTKMSLFFNQNKAATEKKGSRAESNRYVSHFMMPTLSDKTTMPLVTAIKHNVTKDFNGNDLILTEGATSEELLVVAMAEVDRINHHISNVDNKDYIGNRLSGYKDGANKFFFYPFLNKELLSKESAEIIWEGERVSTSPAAKAEMKKLIAENVTKLIDNKVDSWIQDGFIEVNKDGLYNFKLFDQNYKRNILFPIKAEDGDRSVKMAKYAAADYVINSLIANANIMQIMAGDPAMFYKKGDTVLDGVKNTWDNIGKRLAKEIAPGLDIPKGPKDSYTSIFLKDIRENSSNIEELTESLNKAGLSADAYKGIELTDAQEYTTGLEHVYVMYQMGKLTDKEYARITKLLKAGKDLNIRDLGKVLQTMKPVYVKNIIDPSGIERVVYIKSSSFPLLPQITKGLEIDGLRRMMEGVDENDNLLPGVSSEEARNKISRASYNTAAKLGSIDAIDWRSAKSEDVYKTHSVTNAQDRSGLRIQQELPFSNTKTEITKGTQETALLFINILDSEGFTYKGKEYDGKQMMQKFTDLHKKIFTHGKDKLLSEVANENGEVDIKKVQKVLLDEAMNKGYSLSDIQSLQLHRETEFREVLSLPLWANASANKFESLLTSIVSNRVTKLKARGFSGPLGSEAGFKIKEGEAAERALKDNRIVFSDSYDAEKGLQPMRIDEETGKMLPAQILAPFKHVDNQGNALDLQDFIVEVDNKSMLDTTKMPKELLKSYGFRTPTQGPNSTSMMEIVGFLPYEMGDLILAPKDFVAQMGSDFDIDKLGAYLFNTNAVYKYGENEEDAAFLLKQFNTHISTPQKTKDGREIVRKDIKDFDIVRAKKEWAGLPENEGTILYLEKEDRFVDKLETEKEFVKLEKYKSKEEGGDIYSWQNDLLDIRFSVLSNTNNEVRAQIAEALEFGKLKIDGKEDITDMVSNGARAKRLEAEKTFMGISAEYQKEVFYAGRAGQIGIGVFSTDSKFNAIAQIAKANGRPLTSIVKDVDDMGNTIMVPNPITFIVDKKPLSSSNFSDKYSVTNPKRYKSQIIAGFQSASVDNAKEQILNKLNINNTTFNAFSAFNQLGWEEEYSVGVMAQDIMFDFVAEIENLKDSIEGTFTEDRTSKAHVNMIEKYFPAQSFENVEAFTKWKADLDANPHLSAEELKRAIEEGPSYGEYNRVQYLAMNYFMQANEIGESLRNVKYAINTDSKHLGKSFIETQHKEDAAKGLDLNSHIDNADALLGDVVYDENGNPLLMPNTIPGYATTDGVLTANSLFANLFPYQAGGVDLVTREILDIADVKETSMTKFFDTKRKVFMGIKSYLWSKQEIGLITDATHAQERQRLMFDASEVQKVVSEKLNEAGAIIKTTKETRVHTHKSLASIVHAFSKTVPGKRNPLVRLLTTEIDVSGKKPSTIEYNAAAGENMDESLLHSALVELLNSDNEETVTMAQDLINYAVLNGFTQGASNFVKFVSPAYLDAMGVNEAFREFDLQLGKGDIFGASDSSQDPVYVSKFAKQFIQHNPDLAPKLGIEHIPNGKTSLPAEFNLKVKPELAYMIKPSLTHMTYKKFVAVYDDKAPKKYRLYENIGMASEDTVIFREIDTLGYTKGVTEYSPEVKEATSLIEANQAKVTKSAPKKIVPTKVIDAKKSSKSEINTELTGKIYQEYGLIGADGKPINTFGGEGIPVILNTLGQITALAETNGEKVMATVLSKAVEVLQPNIDIRVGDMYIPVPENNTKNNKQKIGAGINIRPTGYDGLNIIGINTSLNAHKTRASINETIMHELTHALTVNSLATLPRSKSAQKIESLFDDISDRVLHGDLSGTKVGNFTLDAETLWDFGQSYENWTKRNAAGRNTNPSEKEQNEIDKWNKYVRDGALDVLYPFYNSKEFVTAAMTNADFQLWLNSIPHTETGDASIWDKLLQLISELFSDFTIGDTGQKVIAGNTLEASLANILDIIEENSAGAFSKSLTLKKDSGEKAPVIINKKRLRVGRPGSNVDTETEANTKAEFTYNGITLPTEFPLSNEQDKVLKELIDFAISGSDNIRTLEGYAGTGKTSIIALVEQYVKQAVAGAEFGYMAPTHAATVALGLNTVKYGNTDLPATFASSVYYDRRNKQFTLTKKMKDRIQGFNPFIVVDEASMLQAEQVQQLEDIANSQGIKVIFVGDPKQIPAVSTSNAKTKPLSTAFTKFPKSSLSKVFRTGDESLLSILTKIRNNTEFTPYTAEESTNDLQFVNLRDYAAELKRDLTESPEDVAILSYTNQSVKQNNQNARKMMGITGELRVGEKVIGYLGSGTKQIEKQHLANSIPYTVKELNKNTDGTVTVIADSSILADAMKKGMKLTSSATEFTYLQLSATDSMTFGLSEEQFKANNDKLSNIYRQIHELNVRLDNKTIHYLSYLDAVQQLQKVAADYNTGNTYIFNPKSDKMEMYVAQTHKYLKSNLKMDKGIDFGYAFTIHKSQGMTIPKVYFDPGSLRPAGSTKIMAKGVAMNTEKNALYYVAMSRASKKLVVASDKAVKRAEVAPDENIEDYVDGEAPWHNGPPDHTQQAPPPSEDDLLGGAELNVDNMPMRGPNAISDSEYYQTIKAISQQHLLQKKKYWMNGRQYQRARVYGAEKGRAISREIQTAFPWVGVHINPIEGGKVRLALYDNRPKVNRTSEDAPMSMTERIEEAEGEGKTSTQITLDYLKGRVNVINRAISNFKDNPKKLHALQERRERIEADIESLLNDETTSNLVRIAESELAIAREIFNQNNLGDTDYEYIANSLEQIRGVVEFWKSVNIFTDEQLRGSFLNLGESKEKTKVYSPAVERMHTVIREADSLLKSSTTLMRENMFKAMTDTKGIQLAATKSASDLEQFVDISWIRSRTMSLNRQDNELLQVISKWTKDATARTNDEAKVIFKDLENLTKSVQNTSEFKAEGWDLFAQVTKDGDRTGELVSRFSQDYYDARRRKMKYAMKVDTPKAWDSFYKWKKENEIIFDVRKLFFEDGDGKFNEADRDAHIAELKGHLGEVGFEGAYTTVNRKYQDYKNLEEAAYIEIESRGEDAGTTEEMKLHWRKKNSPLIYAEVMIDGAKNLMDNKFVKSEGYKYTYNAPRKTNKNGDTTGWYDEKFEVIENNEALSEFYEFFTGVTSQMVNFLPRHFKEDVQVNTLPELRRTLIEKIYSQKNLKAGFNGITDAIKESVSTREIKDTTNQDVNPATGQLNPSSPVTMLQGTMSADEKSYELDKVLKAFATMAIAFKHKSRVENLLRNAQTIVADAEEITETADGKLLKKKGGEVLRGKNALSNTKAVLDYGIESFYGLRKPESGITKKKLYTVEENKILKKANEEITAVTEQLSNEEITQEEFDEAIQEIEEKYNLKDLGMNLTGSKMIKSFTRYVQLKGMGWNVVSATTNLIFGVLSNMNHASGKRDFSMKQMRSAFSVMLHTSATMISGGYASSKTATKVRNLMMKYDVLKEFNEEASKNVKNANSNKKGIKKLAPYELQKSSEYFGQGQVMVAYMMSTGLDGKKLTKQEIKDNKPSLWEAYDENGNFTEEHTGNVEWEGDLDNLEHNQTKYSFQTKLDQILESVHGNYNPSSPILAKKTVWGQLLFQYRSWMPEGIASRFETKTYDSILERERKGRYNTYVTLGFKDSLSVMLKQIAMQGEQAFEGEFKGQGKDGKAGPMSEIDKENMRRNLFGLASMAALMGLGLALRALTGDDDDEDKEITNYLLNQIYRLETDLTFYTNVESFEALLQNPIPAFGVIHDGAVLMGSVKDYLMGEEDIIKHGPNAGESRLFRSTIKVTPFENLTLKLKQNTEQRFEDKD